MLINFLLALAFIVLSLGVLITIDSTTALMNKMVKNILKWTHRSKLLTEYILRAYMRYRKTINKPLIHNSHSL